MVNLKSELDLGAFETESTQLGTGFSFDENSTELDVKRRSTIDSNNQNMKDSWNGKLKFQRGFIVKHTRKNSFEVNGASSLTPRKIERMKENMMTPDANGGVSVGRRLFGESNENFMEDKNKENDFNAKNQPFVSDKEQSEFMHRRKKLSLFSRRQMKSKFAQQEQSEAENNQRQENDDQIAEPEKAEEDCCATAFANQKPLDVKIGDILGEGEFLISMFCIDFFS